jgi:hypothetical protein
VLRRARRIPGREWLDFAHAQWALIVARVRLRVRPPGWLVARGLPPDESTPADDFASRATELARAVDRAARYGPSRPSCLVRALALQNLLLAAGIPDGRIRIGVRRDAAGDVAAHAWVTCGSLVFDASDDNGPEYTVLKDLRVEWL